MTLLTLVDEEFPINIDYHRYDLGVVSVGVCVSTKKLRLWSLRRTPERDRRPPVIRVKVLTRRYDPSFTGTLVVSWVLSTHSYIFMGYKERGSTFWNFRNWCISESPRRTLGLVNGCSFDECLYKKYPKEEKGRREGMEIVIKNPSERFPCQSEFRNPSSNWRPL